MKVEVLKEALGIDVSKDGLSLCLGILKSDLEKDFISWEDVPNDNKAYKRLEKWLSKLSVGTAKPIIVIEATGVYHEGITLYLHKLGYKVCVMQSGRVKSYAKSLN